MNATAYPLTWPMGWKRCSVRTRARFGRKGAGWGNPGGYSGKQALSIDQATRRVIEELRLFGIPDWNVIVSTNLELRNDGLPRSNQRAPVDPGAAVYWRDGKQERCIAIDRYDRVADNLAAIAATLDAMRAIERHGGAAILDRAFTGFAALPAPEQPFQVLGVGANASKADDCFAVPHPPRDLLRPSRRRDARVHEAAAEEPRAQQGGAQGKEAMSDTADAPKRGTDLTEGKS